jgi:hypothetical protein
MVDPERIAAPTRSDVGGEDPLPVYDDKHEVLATFLTVPDPADSRSAVVIVKLPHEAWGTIGDEYFNYYVKTGTVMGNAMGNDGVKYNSPSERFASVLKQLEDRAETLGTDEL